MTYRVSPGVYPRIIDDSFDAVYTNPNIAATVGGHTRGPLGPFLVTSVRNRKKRYGLNNAAWGHFIDTSDAFLVEGTQLYMDRVVSADCKYGLGLFCNNVIGGQPAGTSYTSIPAGSTVPYSQVNRGVWDMEVVGLFVADSTVRATINSTQTISVPFTNDHNTTMAVFTQAVQNVLDGLAPGGYAWQCPVGANDAIVRVISPQAITLAISATTTGTGAPTVQVRAADWLGFVVAQNPGSWSSQNNTLGYNGVAVGISNVDLGTPQRLRLSFSTAIVANQSITFTDSNGLTFLTPFAVNNNQTLINFCANFQQKYPGSSATVVPSATTSNNLQVQLVAADANSTVTITTLSVSNTDGVSRPLPVITYVQTLTPVRSNGTFNLVVYENANFVQPDELYLCTVKDGTDGLGSPTGLDYVINGIDSVSGLRARVSPSSRISITVNPNFSGIINSSTQVTNSNYDRYLGGGADGSIPSTQQIVTGWDDFSNNERITVRVLLNAGYATPEVHQKMMAISGKRQDCFSILDTPSNLQAPEDAANYRQTIMAVNSFWGAMYSPDILVYDADIGRRRYVPPSGQVGAQYAYNDRVASAYFAPAGLTRGILPNALSCRYTYEEGDRDTLSQAQVNAIRFIDNAWTIWGEYTLQTATSALSSVPVVRMVIEVITEAATTVAYSVFEPNNRYTWHRVTSRLNGILQPIEDAEGLTDFVVQCDEKNNTPQIIQQRVMKIAMWLKPVLCALYIQLDAIITRQDAVFSIEETLSANMY